MARGPAGSTRRCLSTRLLVACWIFAATGIAHAQIGREASEALLECRKLENGDARLACFDAALAGEGEARAPRTSTTPVAAPVESLVEPSSGTSRGLEAPPQSPNDEPRAGFAVEKSAEPPSQFTISVVDVRENSLNGIRISTADGRVWRQTDGRAARFPDTPFTTTVEQASFGSYLMSIPNSRQRVRISPID